MYFHKTRQRKRPIQLTFFLSSKMTESVHNELQQLLLCSCNNKKTQLLIAPMHDFGHNKSGRVG